PRSGTSMMMRMLEAGGLSVAQDHKRQADESNPKGYYELEAVKQLPEDPSVLASHRGQAVKIIFALAYHLPADKQHALLVMRRPAGEVLESQRRMLLRRGLEVTPLAIEELEGALEEFLGWARASSHLNVLEVHYHAVLSNPLGESDRIASHLGHTLNLEAMVEAVDPHLHRVKETH
ncbi:MAG: sulfotransferase family protein, partial [Myxococcota bacterium]